MHTAKAITINTRSAIRLDMKSYCQVKGGFSSLSSELSIESTTAFGELIFLNSIMNSAKLLLNSINRYKSAFFVNFNV